MYAFIVLSALALGELPRHHKLDESAFGTTIYVHKGDYVSIRTRKPWRAFSYSHVDAFRLKMIRDMDDGEIFVFKVQTNEDTVLHLNVIDDVTHKVKKIQINFQLTESRRLR